MSIIFLLSCIYCANTETIDVNIGFIKSKKVSAKKKPSKEEEDIEPVVEEQNLVGVQLPETGILPDVDNDDDGLIEIYTPQMFNNMRYDLAGASYKESSSDAGNSFGCPDSGCYGYELTANIDLLSLLDRNNDGEINTITIGIDKNSDGDSDDTNEQVTVIDINEDSSWIPIGDSKDNAFAGTFEGNRHTITNLWVNITSSSNNIYGGLFGATNGISVIIRNVKILSGSIHSSSSLGFAYSGSLVGGAYDFLTIERSGFSGLSGVFSSTSTDGLENHSSDSSSGGLVGYSDASLTISYSFFKGSEGTSSSSPSNSYSGGLIGYSTSSTSPPPPLVISHSYFSGKFGVFSSSFSSPNDPTSYSGGLVGRRSGPLIIMNSYFSAKKGVFSSSSAPSPFDPSGSYSGGLVGLSDSSIIINSYLSGSGKVSSSSTAPPPPPDNYTASHPRSYSGGLVGHSNSPSKITHSYFSGSGGVFSNSSLLSYSGGLVGISESLTIMNSYYSGAGTISAKTTSGGLVAQVSRTSILTIINSYFGRSGGIFSYSTSPFVGALIAYKPSKPPIIKNTYWNRNTLNNGLLWGAFGDANDPSGATGISLENLKAINGDAHPSNLRLPTPGIGDAWDLGYVNQLPAIKKCVNPTISDDNITVTCESYSILLAGQGGRRR